MTNDEFEKKFSELVKTERKITSEILSMIREAERRKIYLERGFPSMFDWLVKAHHYSHSAANRRIQASRLLTDVPEVSAKLESGEVNLSTLAQIQQVVSRERKQGRKISAKEKQRLVQKIEGKSFEDTQRLLAAEFPESTPKQDSLRPIGESASRLNVDIDDETVTLLKEIKQMLSHSNPTASWGDAIKFAAKDVVSRKKKLTQSSAESAAHGDNKAAVHRSIIARGCEFKDEKTGRVCGSHFQGQVDHIVPRALGGTDDPSNLRCLCRKHNLLMAERYFGKRHMSRFWGNSG